MDDEQEEGRHGGKRRAEGDFRDRGDGLELRKVVADRRQGEDSAEGRDRGGNDFEGWGGGDGGLDELQRRSPGGNAVLDCGVLVGGMWNSVSVTVVWLDRDVCSSDRNRLEERVGMANTGAFDGDDQEADRGEEGPESDETANRGNTRSSMHGTSGGLNGQRSTATPPVA